MRLKGGDLIKWLLGYYSSNSKTGINRRITILSIIHFMLSIVNIEQGVTIVVSIAIYKYAVGINFGEYYFLHQ